MLLLALAGLALGCDKAERAQCGCSHTGILQDWTGFDGCGWMLLADDGTVYEVREWPAEGFAPRQNLRVRYSLREVEPMASICMVGPPAVFDCLEGLGVAEDAPPPGARRQ